MEVSASMAAAAAFSITSPDWARRAAGLKRTNIHLVVRDAAVVTAEKLVEPLRNAAMAAGGSAALASDVKVHDAHTNDLVMRDQAHWGDVIVGVSGESRHADEAEELEWGSPDEGPKAWVRTTTGKLGSQVVTMYSNELTRQFDRAVLGR